MGRKSKLNTNQWNEIERRRIVDRESWRSLEKAFGISQSTIRYHLSAQCKNIEVVANQLAAAEIAVCELPKAAQQIARDHAENIKITRVNLESAAAMAAEATNHLMTHLVFETGRIKAAKTDEDRVSNGNALQAVAALADTINKTAVTSFKTLSYAKAAELADFRMSRANSQNNPDVDFAELQAQAQADAQSAVATDEENKRIAAELHAGILQYMQNLADQATGITIENVNPMPTQPSFQDPSIAGHHNGMSGGRSFDVPQSPPQQQPHAQIPEPQERPSRSFPPPRIPFKPEIVRTLDADDDIDDWNG